MSAVMAQTHAYVVSPTAEGNEQILIDIQHSIQTGDFHNARTEVQRAFEYFPDDPRLYNFLGVIDAQQQSFSDAQTNFQRAIKIAPRFVGAYMNLGRLYQAMSATDTNYWERALDIYSRVCEMEPSNTEARYQTASVLNRLGRLSASLKQLSQLPAEEQRRAAALSLRCADEAGLQHKDLAKASAMELLEAPDIQEIDVLSILDALVKNRQPDLATMLLESLVKRNSASADVMERLGSLYETQQKFGDARKILTKELEMQGQPSPDLLRHLARIAYKLGDFEQALGYLAHARDLEPGNAATHFLFGLVCIDLKLPPEAEDSLKQAVRLDPQNPFYSYALGAVQLERHNPDEAIGHFKKYQEAKQRDPRGSFALGIAYFDANQSEPARRELELAAAHTQTRAGALLYLGRLALREQNLTEASDDLQRAIQANPAMVQPYIEIAIVQLRTKKYDDAKQNLTRALRLAPDNYQANSSLLVLYKKTNDSRAEEQSRHLAVLREANDEREKMLLRSLDIRPY